MRIETSENSKKVTREIVIRLTKGKMWKRKKDVNNDESLGQEKDTDMQSGELKKDIAEEVSSTPQESDSESKNEKSNKDDNTVAEKKQRRKWRKRSAEQKQMKTEDTAKTPKKKQANFVMNSNGCFLNGKPLDPNNLPDGVVIIADQKKAGK